MNAAVRRECASAGSNRYQVWASEVDRVAYLGAVRSAYLLRAPARESAPLPPAALRRRGTGISEASMPGIAAGIVELQSGVLETLGPRFTLLYASNLTDHPLDGSVCIAARTNCLGDNHDTNYVVSSSLSLEDDDLFVFLGTDSVETQKCVLTAISLAVMLCGCCAVNAKA
jgi:hypothetical protein